ncbi:hypothetical protein LBW62_19870 [Ralstonia solanacearum]|uniref:SWIM zinc finger family protein n=1 Tax=Ralstonia solanacearum TaxID=305 RepID=UPI0005C46848|nr:hypothetical protein [Ralstonia solanacearum]MDB0543491.1 hypothetical protein [Ralstonia solanacearum]MDB0553597.1 hypothetical protein [Ralstonia solanacearum]MDB0558442.1 hypothetical protein [Ralstonia solanacearum]
MDYYGGWKPYVSVAERRRKAEQLIAKVIKAGKTLSPISPYRGAIAKTFWGKAWCDNLERYSDYDSRLPRGRTYTRNGSVIDLQITAGKIHAQVMGSSLYTIKIDVAVCPEPQWRALSADCASSIDSMVELLQGKLSGAVMERICKPGTGLFPSPKEIQFGCSCPDWASMCKHVAAVLYGVGARLDQQPELLFTLRGVDPADLINNTSAKLSGDARAPTSGKVLDHALLGDVFGIEIDTEEPLVAPTPTPKRTGKPSAQRTGQVSTSSATSKLGSGAKSTSKGKTVVAKAVVKSVVSPTDKTRPDTPKPTRSTAPQKPPARSRAAPPPPRKSKTSK